ncbi:hypothetical protein JDV02_007126 [Purpureocillium takamizusanense]|uniref:Uncharacterized protein n=1 Tax=Purpureocillium takamizusanense TaxID=2060973 RepID=A0A9Q8VCY0_9HYPO|nr:uncharacterized protein JDV02_007126 [Purpureocillium takamizusanense]UNI21108.1 hypothetical protein JDV02_007126 [Purpureocillium takamizusanense]
MRLLALLLVQLHMHTCLAATLRAGRDVAAIEERTTVTTTTVAHVPGGRRNDNNYNNYNDDDDDDDDDDDYSDDNDNDDDISYNRAHNDTMLVPRGETWFHCSEGQDMCWRSGMTRNVFGFMEDHYRDLVSEKKYLNGERLICIPIALGPTGFCLFWERLEKGEYRLGETAKRLLKKLLTCEDKKCGYVAFTDSSARLKIDYVGNVHGCNGIC